MIVLTKAVKSILSLFQQQELIPEESVMKYLQNYSSDDYKPISVDVHLKHSIYNISKNNGRTYIMYNTLHNSMITLSDTEYHQYEKLEFSDLSIVGTLVDNGFVIPCNIDEYKHYEYYQNALHSQFETPFHCTVALTSKCNARCIYCYEEGVKQIDMSDEIADKLASILCNSDEQIDITWFGGEPLIKIDIIERLSKYFCEHDKPFSSGIITNGSLLTAKMIIEDFPRWHIEWAQISIDGMRDEYLRRKCYCNGSQTVFDEVINNIECLINNNIPVSVRLNIDSDNTEESIKVAEYLKVRFKDNSNISVYPAFISGGTHGISDEETRMECSKRIFSLYPPERAIFRNNPKVNSCYYQQPKAFVVDSDGSILCCERDIGRANTKLTSVWDIDTFDGLQKPQPLLTKTREQCKKCVYYPKCLGGCVATHNSPCSLDACFIEKYKLEYLLSSVIKA